MLGLVPMSLRALVSGILPQFPQIQPDMEVEVLQELPVETLYLALKEADPETAVWFYQNALPSQVQGLVDIDCWTGSEFHVDRAISFFKDISLMDPVKLREYMQGLDPELIVRVLLELCEVKDFDHQEPIDLPENHFIISPDNKYVLVLKTEDPSVRESLMHWLNHLSASNLDLMRRHLESCKWEQISDLEEFSYQIKKGRLEDMGFVDYHEALKIYSFGSASELRDQLIKNPISKDQKLRVRSLNDADETQEPLMPQEWWPQALAGPLNADGFLSKALSEITNPALRETLLQEIIRTVNASLAADKVLHQDLEEISKAAARARKYLDLGLTYLAQGQKTQGANWLETQALTEIYRVGWLVVQDLQKAVKQLIQKTPVHFFGDTDAQLLQSLLGRHPTLEGKLAQELEIPLGDLLNLEAVLKIGQRLAELAWIQNFFLENLEASLGFSQRALLPQESAYARLCTLLFRQNHESVDDVVLNPSPLSLEEWKKGAADFNADKFSKSLKLIIAQAPEAARTLLDQRVQGIVSDIAFFVKSSPEKIPDQRFFKGLVFLKATEN
jgi:hypothetical protein